MDSSTVAESNASHSRVLDSHHADYPETRERQVREDHAAQSGLKHGPMRLLASAPYAVS
jgi:hypothetical protein